MPLRVTINCKHRHLVLQTLVISLIFPFILVLCINKMSSASFWFHSNSNVLRINYEKLPLHLKSESGHHCSTFIYRCTYLFPCVHC